MGGHWSLKLGYRDINLSIRALGGWIMVFRNWDIGISDPLYRGPDNGKVGIAFDCDHTKLESRITKSHHQNCLWEERAFLLDHYHVAASLSEW